MKTTDFILELIIAGLGTLAWIILLFLALIDIDWEFFSNLVSREGFLGLATLIVLLVAPFIYIIGIVTDRLVDNLLDAWFANRITRENFGGTHIDYKRAVALVYMGPIGLKEAFTYSRMRIRICRAWAYNSALIMISINLLLALRNDWFLQPGRLALFFSVLLLVSTLVSFQAWKTLIKKECVSLKVNQELLQKEEKKAFFQDKQRKKQKDRK